MPWIYFFVRLVHGGRRDGVRWVKSVFRARSIYGLVHRTNRLT